MSWFSTVNISHTKLQYSYVTSDAPFQCDCIKKIYDDETFIPVDMKFAKFKNNQQSRWELTWVILKHKRNVAKPIVSNDEKTSIRRYTFAYLLAFCKREPFDYLLHLD